jgi:hypothetical protein
VLLEQNDTDEADDGVFVGEASDDIGATLNLADDALNRVVRVQLGAPLFCEGHIGEHIGLGLIYAAADFWYFGLYLIGPGARSGAGSFSGSPRCLIPGFDGAIFPLNGGVRYGISQKTVAKWKKRMSAADLQTGPKEPESTVLTVEDEGCHCWLPTAHVASARRLPLFPSSHNPSSDALVLASLSAAARCLKTST